MPTIDKDIKIKRLKTVVVYLTIGLILSLIVIGFLLVRSPQTQNVSQSNEQVQQDTQEAPSSTHASYQLITPDTSVWVVMDPPKHERTKR
jgi:fucose permease